jgi:hypothetical protein
MFICLADFLSVISAAGGRGVGAETGTAVTVTATVGGDSILRESLKNPMKLSSPESQK